MQIGKAYIVTQVVIGIAAAIVTIILALMIPPLLEQRAVLLERVEELDYEIEHREGTVEDLGVMESDLNASLQNLRDEVARTRNELKAAEEALAAAKAELEIQRQQVETRTRQLAEREIEIDYASAQLAQGNVELAQDALKVNRADSVIDASARVYIHIPSREQAPLAQKVTRALQAEKIIVPGTEIVVKQAPRATELRYFRRTESPEAQDIADYLNATVPEVEWRATYVQGYENSTDIRPHHFEIWFGAGR